MKNKSYLNRLHCKQSGRFIAVPNAVINDFVVWCRQRGVSAIKVHRYCDHLRRLRPRFRWRQKANLLDLTVDDLDDIQRFCRLRSPSLARGIAVFRSFLQSTDRLAPSEPVRVVKPRSYFRLNVEDLRRVALPVPNAIITTIDSGQSPIPRPVAKAARRPKGSLTDSVGRRSFLAKPISDYLATQRALGRAFRSEEWILLTLDQVLAGDFPKGRTLTANMFAKWAEVHAIVSPTTRRHRMLCVRKFCG